MKVIVGRHAALFDKASGLALGWLHRRVAQRVAAELPADGRVLDVGTGPGRLLLELARRRPDAHVVGIDPSADMVGHARRHLRAAGAAGAAGADGTEVRVAAAEDLPYPDGSFDAVVSTLSAHHWAERSAAIAEQARVLRPGGVLWVVDIRAKSASVGTALAEAFAVESITQPSLGGLPRTFLVCLRAVKSTTRD